MAKRAYDPKLVRTFALVGHRSSGKTSLAEVLLKTAGVTRSVGRVDERSSLLDHEPEERRRGMTLGPAFAWLEWDGHLLNLVDTPGSAGLAHERALAVSGVDAAVVVIGAPDGVEVGTENVLEEALRLGVPRVVVVNKMDRATFDEQMLARLEEVTGARVVPVQMPFFDDEGHFSGVVCPFRRQVLRYDLEGSGAFSPEPVPDRLVDELAAARDRLAEAVALTDDVLLERYLEFLDLPDDVVREGLARAIRDGLVLPVLFTSASACMGAEALLDFAAWALPAPSDRVRTAATADGGEVPLDDAGPFVAQLLATRLDEEGARYHVLRVVSGSAPLNGQWWCPETERVGRVRKVYQIRGPRRTTAANTGPGAIIATWDTLDGRPGSVWTDGVRLRLAVPPIPAPMMSYVLTPLTQRDGERLPAALDILLSLDGALVQESCPLTGAAMISGLGPIHLERNVEILRERLGVRVATALPLVPYREVPARVVRDAIGVHQRGDESDVKEFGQVVIDVMPVPMEDGVVVRASLDEELLPARYLPAVEEGLRQGLLRGPTAGYPVHGVEVRVVSGEYDLFASEDAHFRAAGERAAQTALKASGTHVYEPWSSLVVRAPASEIGSVLSDLSAHRGRILGMEVEGLVAVVRAHAPYREVRTLASRLQSITGGRGQFTRAHSHYAPVPGALVKEAITASPFRNDPAARAVSSSRPLAGEGGGSAKPAVVDVFSSVHSSRAFAPGAKP